jgi:hypothetical protein
MKKRKDECLFCTSRKCNTRVVRQEEPLFDEVSCDKHINLLYGHADAVLGRKGSGVYRHHISSSGMLKRGESIK